MGVVWPIPNALQSEIARVLGFPARLAGASLDSYYPTYASQYAMFQPYAVLVNKLAQLATLPDDAVPIFGSSHPAFGSYFTPATFAFTISSPNAGPDLGAEVAIAINGDAAVSVGAVAGDTPQSFALTLAAAIVDPSVVAVCSGATITLYATAQGEAGNGLPVSIVAQEPTLTVGPYPVISGTLSGGSNPPGPFFTPDGATLPVYGYLPTIRVLESDLAGARDNLDTRSAGEFFTNPNEMRDRAMLLKRYRRELADRLGVPLDPDIVGNRRRSRTRVI